MSGELPIDAIRAEIESWPIASPTAFREALTQLELGDDRVLRGPTKALWQELERELRLRAGRASPAELVPIRDDAWFSKADMTRPGIHSGAVPLHTYICRLAAGLLEYNLDRALPRTPSRDDPTAAADAVERWRWTSIYLPPDLLLAAAAAAASPPTGAHGRVDLAPQALSQLLQYKPVAQQHLHIGAGPNLGRLWDALTKEIDLPKHFDGEMPTEEFDRILLASGFVRRVLTEHVRLLEHGLTASLNDTLAWFAEDCASRRGRTPYDWKRDSARLVRVLLKPAELSESRHWMVRARTRLPPVRREYEHRELLRNCFVALRQKEDPRLEVLFIQYIRVYTATYRHIVQDPSSCGLDWFTRYYDRISPMTLRSIKRARLTETIRSENVGLQLGSLEIRTKPEATWHEIGQEVRDYARQILAWKESAPYEWGVTFHFIKRHEVAINATRKQRVGDVGPGGRYGRWFRDSQRQARALAYLIRRRPEVLTVIRGVDVANVELAVPTWIVAPLLKQLQQVSAEIATQHPLARVARLCIVPHIGEDYRRLSEGLRRVDEALVTGTVTRRGRIGHGLALGVRPERWAARHQNVYQPLEERLFDLLWELALVERGAIVLNRARRAMVESEIRHWATQLFGEVTGSLSSLVQCYNALLHVDGVVRRYNYGHADATRISCKSYTERWLYDRGVFLRGLQPVAVWSSNEEMTVLGQVQHQLAARLREQEITIESNPSSNLLVGGLDEFRHHPMFRFRPMPSTMDPLLISVSINSDDPMSFATCLADEYAYIYNALAREQISSVDALEWIDRVRDSGWDSRITTPLSRDTAVLERLARLRRRG